MEITIITLFPDMLAHYFNESILGRAQKKGHVTISLVDVRDFAVDAHRTVDDRPFGGGAGMVLMAEPVIKAIQHAQKKEKKSYVVGTSARGKVFSQEKAQFLAAKAHMVIFAGHYEGYDERINKYVDEEISIGDFIMTGGELAAACITDAVVRLLPGVLKKEVATQEESFFSVSIDELISAVGEDELLKTVASKGIQKVRLLEYAQYTRPQTYMNIKVPEVLVSGDPKKIRKWQLKNAYLITKDRRPDLLSS